MARRDAQPLLQRFWRIDDGTDADDSALDPIEFEAAMAAGSPVRDFPERSDDDINLRYTGGTTGMPKGVMCGAGRRVLNRSGGGIDVDQRRAGHDPSEASDRSTLPGTARRHQPADPPLMHGAGQFSIFRVTMRGQPRSSSTKFDAEETWRLVEKSTR